MKSQTSNDTQQTTTSNNNNQQQPHPTNYSKPEIIRSTTLARTATATAVAAITVAVQLLERQLNNDNNQPVTNNEQ